MVKNYMYIQTHVNCLRGKKSSLKKKRYEKSVSPGSCPPVLPRQPLSAASCVPPKTYHAYIIKYTCVFLKMYIILSYNINILFCTLKMFHITKLHITTKSSTLFFFLRIKTIYLSKRSGCFALFLK